MRLEERNSYETNKIANEIKLFYSLSGVGAQEKHTLGAEGIFNKRSPRFAFSYATNLLKFRAQ